MSSESLITQADDDADRHPSLQELAQTVDEFFERSEAIAAMMDGKHTATSDETAEGAEQFKADCVSFLQGPQPISRWKAAFAEESLSAKMRYGDFRNHYIRYQGFCILTTELVDTLGEVLHGQRVLEVGCGRGALAQALKTRFPALSLTAVDKFTTENRYGFAPALDLVLQADAVEFLKEHIESFDTVMMVWPPYNRPFAYHIAKAMRPGMRLVHCHEGSTGDAQFSQYVHDAFEIESRPNAKLNTVHQRFWLMGDCWQVCTKTDN